GSPARTLSRCRETGLSDTTLNSRSRISFRGFCGSALIEVLLFRQREREDQVPATAASFAATRGDCHELFAVDHVHRRRTVDAGAGVELPQFLAGLGIERHEISCGITPAASKHQSSSGDDGAALSP